MHNQFPRPAGPMTLTSDDLRTIVHAVQSTPQFQFLTQLMATRQTPEQLRQIRSLAQQFAAGLNRSAQPAVAGRY